MLLVQEVAQREGDGPSQAPIGNYELVLGGQLDNAELVDEPGQDQDTCQGRQRRGQAVQEAPPSKPIQLTQSLGPSAQELQITQPKTLVGL